MRIGRRGAIIAAALALSVAGGARAETRDGRLWMGAAVSGSLSGPLLYGADIQFRTANALHRVDQVSLRGMIGWKASDRVSVYQGYFYADNPNGARPAAREHRVFQQLNWTAVSRPDWQLTTRTRLEERWRVGADGMGLRLRQQLRLRVPLSDRQRPLAGIVAVEGLRNLNDTDWGLHRGWDQFRAGAAVEVPVATGTTVELGYTHQHVVLAGAPDLANHIAHISFSWKP